MLSAMSKRTAISVPRALLCFRTQLSASKLTGQALGGTVRIQLHLASGLFERQLELFEEGRYRVDRNPSGTAD
jgi:hypothetical protein